MVNDITVPFKKIARRGYRQLEAQREANYLVLFAQELT